MANQLYSSRPPATARVARKIWDLMEAKYGKDSFSELWYNWNGIVFGYQMSDADYECWKVGDGLSRATDVDDFILIMAGVKCNRMPLQKYLAKVNPKMLAIYEKQIKELENNLAEARK